MRSLLLLAAGGMSGACSSDAGLIDPAVGGAGIGGGGGAVGDAAAGADGGGSDRGAVLNGGMTRVFSGTAKMLFNGPSCTQEEGATGDRWCAFVTFTDATMQARSLYVFNATRAAAGVDVRCGTAADTDCLLLTADLWGDSSSPVLHGTFFQGDTLVYYQQGFAPYVWRPGMTGGRLLATFAVGEDAVYCTPSPRGPAVLCVLLPNAAADPNPTVAFAELLIGKADGANEPLLSAADTVVVWSAADAGFKPTFGFGFPPGPGDNVAWTTRDGETGPETLKLQQAGDAASKVTIASDVHHWRVSPDASRWFWLRGTMGTGVGTLQTAPFPGGANPIDLHAEVSEYDFPSDGQAVVALTKDHALVAIPDPLAAAGELVLDTDVQLLSWFSGAGHVAYVKNRVGASSGDLFVKHADGTTACIVDQTRQVPFPSVSFAPNAGAILWARSTGQGFEAHYTRLGDCNTMAVATGITLIESVGHERVLFADQFDDAAGTGRLRIRLVGNGNALTADAPVTIADHADSYAITGPDPDTLLYTVNGDGENDGVYVRWFID